MTEFIFDSKEEDMLKIDLENYYVISKKCNMEQLYGKMQSEFNEGKNSYYAMLKDEKNVWARAMGIYLPGSELSVILYSVAKSDYKVVELKPAHGYYSKENVTKEEKGMIAAIKKGKEVFLERFGKEAELAE